MPVLNGQTGTIPGDLIVFQKKNRNHTATGAVTSGQPKNRKFQGIVLWRYKFRGVNMIKCTNYRLLRSYLFGMITALTGVACADQVVPAVPETQTLGTVTTADVVGLAMETDAGAWTLTNDPVVIDSINNQSLPADAFFDLLAPDQYNVWQAQLQSAGGSIDGFFLANGSFQPTQYNLPNSLLDTLIPGGTNTWSQGFYGITGTITGKGIHNGILDPGQVQYTTAYDASIVAQAGHTVLTKSTNIDTRNKVIGQSNLDAQTELTYLATADGGNVVGSENLLIDGAGNTTSASDRMLCPFGSQPADVIPAYCNIVQAGSRYDLTVGSVTTNANDRFVGTDATSPVVLNYAINVRPYGTSQGQIPAGGSTMAYVKAHIQEARDYNNVTMIFVPSMVPGSVVIRHHRPK